MTDNPPAGIHPLRERLAKVIGAAVMLGDCVPDIDDPAVREWNAAVAGCTADAVREVAAWLRDEAGEIRRDAAKTPEFTYSREKFLAEELERLADAIYPKGAHDGQ